MNKDTAAKRGLTETVGYARNQDDYDKLRAQCEEMKKAGYNVAQWLTDNGYPLV